MEVPADVKPGPVKITVALPTDTEDEEGRWQEAASHLWATEWSDPGKTSTPSKMGSRSMSSGEIHLTIVPVRRKGLGRRSVRLAADWADREHSGDIGRYIDDRDPRRPLTDGSGT